jgi:MFS family permease
MIDSPVTDGNRQSLNAPGQEPTLTELVSGIADDAQRLITQQYQMLRAELKEDIRRTKSALTYMGFGIAATAVGAIFLVVALPLILNDVLDMEHRPWVGWAIIGGLMLVIGIIGLLAGRAVFKKNNPLPDKTLNALEENLSWIANRRS